MIPILTPIFIVIVALMHFYIMYFEMFAFTKPRTLKTFNITKEKAENAKELAANQGLYNGFLAAGLVWSVLYPAPPNWLTNRTFLLKLCRHRSIIRRRYSVQANFLRTRHPSNHRTHTNDYFYIDENDATHKLRRFSFYKCKFQML
ncbi:hypothetical protein PRIP_08050 [Listeria riparia FSL S10-1204]|uniref:DUF1304 domain-containing protein n=1 Tax=Listeria riparia FSL S10-1204 TaxID=1265816 RepID=W7DC38_9LIST|nr:hypothetical protein PRIP_08050 [Listeria riparia FSL S10-1204]